MKIKTLKVNLTDMGCYDGGLLIDHHIPIVNLFNEFLENKRPGYCEMGEVTAEIHDSKNTRKLIFIYTKNDTLSQTVKEEKI